MQYPSALLVIGLSHKLSSLESREKIANKSPYEWAVRTLYPHIISEIVGLSTCNRTELYIVTNNPRDVSSKLKEFFNTDASYTFEDQFAATHLYQVISGLDSMLLGEYDIVAQVKQAYLQSARTKTAGPMLHQLFQRAIKASKIVRSTTPIGTGITSLARAAVEHAKLNTNNFMNQPVLVIGAGEMGQKIGKYLAKEGVGNITFINRSLIRAQKVALEHGASALPLSELTNALSKSNVVICATSSPDPVITKALLEKSLALRAAPGLHIIDLGVPRDVDSKCEEIKGVTLHNIDTLTARLEVDKGTRATGVAEAQIIINKEADKFWAWRAAREKRLLDPVS